MENKEEDGIIAKLIKSKMKLKIYVGIGVIAGISFLLFLVIMGTLEPITSLFSTDKSLHIEDDKLNDSQKSFKERINKVVEAYEKKHNIKIDKSLVLSTLMYSGNYDQIYDESLQMDQNSLDAEDEDTEDLENSATKEEMKKYRTSRWTINKICKSMIKDNNIDLDYFEDNLANDIVPSLYKDYLDEAHPESSARAIARDIIENASMYKYFLEEDEEESCTQSGACTYNLDGVNISNVKVRLMKCVDEGWGTPIEGEELVDFEKYVLGVTYAEIGPDSPAEAQKTEATAARSYALTRPGAMGSSAGTNIEEKDGQWILSLRNCTEDQVYCDPDKGCYAAGNNTGNTVHSGSNGSQYKGPLAADAPIRAAVAQTAGKLLLRGDGTVINAGYLDVDQRRWIELANTGKDYTEILMEHYNSSYRPYGASTIGESNCSSSGSSSNKTCATNNAAAGPYADWKQCNAPWSNLSVGGGGSVCSIGCAMTSVAMQMARTGVEISIPDFNPGTFVTAMNANGGFTSGGLIYWDVSQFAPRFRLISAEYAVGGASAPDQIRSLLKDGCYLVVNVRQGGHYVAIDRVEGDTVYMMDPGGNGTNLNEVYGFDSKMQAICYKVS
ncbi:MAG: SpoIID/LytB domain-containing protein [Bacilli bacterium]|nr:SpoIID/LytB domain-containing protein [Bacilli bacterium]